MISYDAVTVRYNISQNWHRLELFIERWWSWLIAGVEFSQCHVYGQDRVGFWIILVCDAIDQWEDTYDAGMSTNDLVGFLSLKAIIHGLRALSQVHGVYFRLVLASLLAAFDVRVNILSKEELLHFHIDIRYWGRDWDHDVLLTLYCDPDVLIIGALRALSQVHGVYFRLVLASLLAAFDVRFNILSKEELLHFHIDIRYWGRDWDRDVLLTLYCDPDVLIIGALPPGITCRGFGGWGKLMDFLYCCNFW